MRVGARGAWSLRRSVCSRAIRHDENTDNTQRFGSLTLETRITKCWCIQIMSFLGRAGYYQAGLTKQTEAEVIQTSGK